MRIGEFANLNDLSIDTVRYYVELNLIHPLKKGRYFYFEKEQQEQLDRLLHFKKLHFTLEEIRKIILVEKLGKIETVRESSIYKNMILQKKVAIEGQIKELTQALTELQNELIYIKEQKDVNSKEQGIAFKNIDMICCPKCGNQIEFSDGTLRGNGIYEAKSQCTCGYCLIIDEGIVVANPLTVDRQSPHEPSEEDVDEFVNESPKSFIDFMMNATDEVIRLLSEQSLSNKTLLFMKSGLGPLELRFLQKTTNVGMMMIVDEDLNSLKIVKKSIEANFPNTNVLYICSELNELPIKTEFVDIAIDFIATFMHGFRLDDNLYDFIIPKLKKESRIIGLYFFFKQFNMLSRLDEKKRKLFDGSVPKGLKKNHFIETSNYDEVVLHEGNNINGFFQEGDKVHAKIMNFYRNVKK